MDGTDHLRVDADVEATRAATSGLRILSALGEMRAVRVRPKGATHSRRLVRPRTTRVPIARPGLGSLRGVLLVIEALRGAFAGVADPRQLALRVGAGRRLPAPPI